MFDWGLCEPNEYDTNTEKEVVHRGYASGEAKRDDYEHCEPGRWCDLLGGTVQHLTLFLDTDVTVRTNFALTEFH